MALSHLAGSHLDESADWMSLNVVQGYELLHEMEPYIHQVRDSFVCKDLIQQPSIHCLVILCNEGGHGPLCFQC